MGQTSYTPAQWAAACRCSRRTQGSTGQRFLPLSAAEVMTERKVLCLTVDNGPRLPLLCQIQRKYMFCCVSSWCYVTADEDLRWVLPAPDAAAFSAALYPHPG